ncbi:MAG: NAD(P)H-dependent oxidoreductase [Candidatus Omnitrophica bacterium]|nr:NAD(P)H-dependent oxidoreductase [Candidatus Omnitrophota bacterium]
MKALVLYFSLTGNTKFISHIIRDAIGADEARIPLQGEGVQFENYDVIFIGTPVWAFGVPRPLQRFLEKTTISQKRIAIFCSFSFIQGIVFSGLRGLLKGNTIVGQRAFREPRRYKSKYQAAIAREWAQAIMAS